MVRSPLKQITFKIPYNSESEIYTFTSSWEFMAFCFPLSFWFYFSAVVYVVFTFDHLWCTSDFFQTIVLGTIWFIIYILGLIVVGYIAQGGHKDPRIFWVPVNSYRPLRKSDVEFQMSDEWQF